MHRVNRGGGEVDHTSAAVRVVDVEVPVARFTTVTVVSAHPVFTVTQLPWLDVGGSTPSQGVAWNLLRTRGVTVALWRRKNTQVINDRGKTHQK